MSELYDQDAEAVLDEVKAIMAKMDHRVWVDTESGTFGSDITSVYVLDLKDEAAVEAFSECSDGERSLMAKVFGLPLKQMGCDHREH